MNFEFAQVATATQLFNRMTAKEFFAIYRADTKDQLEYIRQNEFAVDGGVPDMMVMDELKKMVVTKFRALETKWGPLHAQHKNA
jgi:hypothetical protein